MNDVHVGSGGPASAVRRWLLHLSALALVACAAGGAPPSPAAQATAMGPGFAQGGDLAAMAPPEGMEEPNKAAESPAPVPPPAPAEPVMARGEARDEEKPAPPMWAPVRQFPAPNYAGQYDGPRTDFRETIFWQPSVRTDEQGKAQVSFFLSDAVTTFRGTAQGLSSTGVPGHGEAVIASKLPVSLATKLPLEVTKGDVIELPVMVSNTTWRPYAASLEARFGPAFEVSGGDPSRKLRLEAREQSAQFYSLRVVGDGKRAADGAVSVAVATSRLRDAVSRVIRVVPAGFPQEKALAGTLSAKVSAALDLPEPIAGTLQATLSLYPSPAATLVAGTEAMLQEPTGCFEQASSSNYPNVMVMSYLGQQGSVDPALAARSSELLDRGYKKLVGYETKSKGYEWFGGTPAHEALTAYGLLQFADMEKVYRDLDKGMVERTKAWLKSRRDGSGGYQRSAQALDSFGKASDEVTNAYVTYALAEVGEKDLAAEIAYVKKLAVATRDPYVMALAAGAIASADGGSPEAKAALRRLAGMQTPDGRFAGADHSITRSGGQALDIETTSLAALALLKAREDHVKPIRLALEWIAKQRSGGGSFGSTQSTVLALKALTRASERSGAPADGTISVVINGGKAHEIRVDSTAKDTISLAGLEGELRKGKNVIEISATPGAAKLPYSVKIGYRTLRPTSSSRSPVAIALSAPARAKAGDAVKVHATVSNTSPKGIPMAIARIGIPGGLTYQTWQLNELKDKGLVDFYETREREVIVYFRSMAGGAKKSFDLDLIATVPGTFTAPASQAYLYYTDEFKTWADPLQITVTR